jgi:hypothetical protein
MILIKCDIIEFKSVTLFNCTKYNACYCSLLPSFLKERNESAGQIKA